MIGPFLPQGPLGSPLDSDTLIWNLYILSYLLIMAFINWWFLRGPPAKVREERKRQEREEREEESP